MSDEDEFENIATTVSDTKEEFLHRRKLETILGGMKLSIQGDMPTYIKVIQIVLFIMPILIIPFTFIPTLPGVMSLIPALLFDIVIILLHCKGEKAHQKYLQDQPDIEGFGGTEDEETYDFDEKYGEDFYRIVCPSKPNKYLIYLILIVSTACTYLTTLCLNYSKLKEYLNETAIIFIILVPISYMFIHYSLVSHPPTEKSIYKADNYISPYLNRPLIWLIQLIPIILCIYFLNKENVKENRIILAVQFTLLCLDCIFYMIGVIPTMDTFLECFIEYCNYYIFGSTHCASLTRTVLSFITNILLLAIVIVIYNYCDLVLCLSLIPMMGYISSRGNFYDFINLFLKKCKKTNKNCVRKLSSSKIQPEFSSVDYSSLIHTFSLFDIIIACIIVFPIYYIIININLSDLLTNIIDNKLPTILEAVALLLAIINFILIEYQKPYLFNILYNKHRLDVHKLKYLKHGIVVVIKVLHVIALVMTFIFFFTIFDRLEFKKYSGFKICFKIIFMYRAFQFSMIHPTKSILPILISSYLYLSETTTSISPEFLIFIFTIVISPFFDFINTMIYIRISIRSTIEQQKLRYLGNEKVNLLTTILSPFFFIYIYLHNFLSIPLLPFVTLPIYLPSSPRPFRLWPNYGVYTSSEDSLIYQQTFPHLYDKIKEIIMQCGLVGFSSLECGNYFLIRFEKLVVIVSVVESGNEYCYFVVKGLELQKQTSCHNVESGVVDNVILNSFPTEENDIKKYNEFYYHTLQPLVQTKIKTYSLSNTSLAGIITTPDFRRLVQHCCSTLLIYHFTKKDKVPKDVDSQMYGKGIYRNMSQYYHDDFRQFLNGNTPNTLNTHKSCTNEIMAFNQSASDILPLDPVVPSPANREAPANSESEEIFKSFILNLLSFCININDIDFPLSASAMSELFKGNLPSGNYNLNWFEGYKEIVINCYRMSIKLALDLYTLGIMEIVNESTNYQDILENIEEYYNDYYFGMDSDEEWSKSMKNEKTHLFSMYKISTNEYGIKSLFLQNEDCTICKLNPVAVKSIHNSMIMELLYMTNDDEERYSIQSHKQLLRNLCIQFAEPPIGYPVFSTGIINI